MSCGDSEEATDARICRDVLFFTARLFDAVLLWEHIDSLTAVTTSTHTLTCVQEVIDPLGLPGAIAGAGMLPVLIVEVSLGLCQLILVVRERQV